jgi:hypothetical protein
MITVEIRRPCSNDKKLVCSFVNNKKYFFNQLFPLISFIAIHEMSIQLLCQTSNRTFKLFILSNYIHQPPDTHNNDT